MNKFTPLAFTMVKARLNHGEEAALLKHLLSWGSGGIAFEKKFAAFVGSAEAISVTSCFSVSKLAAKLAEFKSRDEVIIPTHAFVATTVPFAHHEVSVRRADIDPGAWVISTDAVSELITAKTKLMVIVHLYGMPADMDTILAGAGNFGIPVVEDCAQAPSAQYKGKRFEASPCGPTVWWMLNWPFDGNRAKYWRPAMSNLVVPMAGQWPRNYCMGEPNCVIRRLLVRRLDKVNAQLQRQANRLIAALQEFPELKLKRVPQGYQHVYHLVPSNYDRSQYSKKTMIL